MRKQYIAKELGINEKLAREIHSDIEKNDQRNGEKTWKRLVGGHHKGLREHLRDGGDRRSERKLEALNLNELPVNEVVCGDCRKVMSEWPEDCIDLVVTSPPYNVGKEYEEGVTKKEYKKLLSEFCKRLEDVLKVDGRFCINIPQTMGSHKVVFSPLYFLLDEIEKSELKLRDIVTWNQMNSDNDTAWGSFASASAPWLRHQAECIVVGYNKRFKKKEKGQSTISNRDFTVWTVDLWTMPTAQHDKHPAIFPKELPRRCIQLFSYRSDIVLDPFCGIGTTCVVAKELGRNYVGIDIEEKYCEIARKELRQETIEAFV